MLASSAQQPGLSTSSSASSIRSAYDRSKCCAYCSEYFDSSSAVYFYSDAAYCSETHRALAVSSSHLHRAESSPPEHRHGDDLQAHTTGVGLRSQLRFWS